MINLVQQKMTETIIKIQDLNKSFGKVQALKNINCSVQVGELFGFIGPDGAGKTTLFRILTSLMIQDSGNASMEGFDVIKDYKSIRNRIGYMPGRFSLYQDLTVEENLRFFAGIFKTTIEENYSLIEDIYKQIEPFKKRRAGKLSGGMKQKLALSCALIHKPTILVLDEPTTGVDAVSRKEFWQMLKKLQKSGITIIVSTPYMDEAILCDRVALIQKGEILSIEKPETIVAQFPHTILSVRSENMYKLTNELREHPECKSAFLFGQYIHFISKEDSVSIEALRTYLSKFNHQNLEILETEPSIEDCFINLMHQ